MVLRVLGVVAALVGAGPDGGARSYCPDGAAAEGAEARGVAAECMAAASDWTTAARLYERVVAEEPTGPLVERSLVALVAGYRSTAQFEQAAQAAEELVTRYPRSVESPELLIEAAWWRVGLGQRAQADADFERYAALFGRSDPARAAEVFWARLEIFKENDAETQAHLGEYLRRYGKVGGADRRIVAEVRLGQIEWRQSCEKGLLADLCMDIDRYYVTPDCVYYRPKRASFLVEKPRPRTPRYCGGDYPRFTFFPRIPRLAEAAQRRFAAVLRVEGAVAAPADQPERGAALAEALGLARMYRADRRLVEVVERGEPPAGLEFMADVSPQQQRRRAESMRRYGAHVAATRRDAQAVAQEYAELARGGPAWEFMASWRVAVLHESVGRSLERVEIPAALDGRYYEQRTYCAEFEPATAPSFAAADTEYQRCTALSLAGDRFAVQPLCEAAMQLRDPVHYPPPIEFAGEPVNSASRPESLGLQPFARWSED